jgi:hypothetical protein
MGEIVLVEAVPSRLIRLIDDLLIPLLIALRPCAPFGGGANLKQLRNVFHSLQLHTKMLFRISEELGALNKKDLRFSPV